jgi:hypothetical protein
MLKLDPEVTRAAWRCSWEREKEKEKAWATIKVTDMVRGTAATPKIGCKPQHGKKRPTFSSG